MSLAKEREVIHGRQAASKVLQVIVKRARIGWTPSVLDRYGRMHEFFDPPALSALQCVAILCGSSSNGGRAAALMLRRLERLLREFDRRTAEARVLG